MVVLSEVEERDDEMERGLVGGHTQRISSDRLQMP